MQKQALCCCIQIPPSPASGGLSPSLISCVLLRNFLTHCGRISLISTPPEDMSFRELPLRNDGPHNPGMPTEPTSGFGGLSSSCFPSAGQVPAFPFGYPSTLLVAVLHQQMTWSSSYSGPFPSFQLANSTVLLILLSPLFPVPCYLPWSTFHGGSCLSFCLTGLLATGTLTSSRVCSLHSSAPLLPFTAWAGTGGLLGFCVLQDVIPRRL